MVTQPSDDEISITREITQTLNYDQLPDWDVYRTASWAIRDTVERVSDE